MILKPPAPPRSATLDYLIGLSPARHTLSPALFLEASLFPPTEVSRRLTFVQREGGDAGTPGGELVGAAHGDGCADGKQRGSAV